MPLSECGIHSFHAYALFVHFTLMFLRSFVILESLLDLEMVKSVFRHSWALPFLEMMLIF